MVTLSYHRMTNLIELYLVYLKQFSFVGAIKSYSLINLLVHALCLHLLTKWKIFVTPFNITSNLTY